VEVAVSIGEFYRSQRAGESQRLGGFQDNLASKSRVLFAVKPHPFLTIVEVTVDRVEQATRRLVKNGCKIVKDELFRAATSKT
jgi:hypothetical protein